MPKDETMQAFELTHLMQNHADSGGIYLEFLNVPDLPAPVPQAQVSMGLYVLPTGGLDPQSPHTEDEVYYIVSGRAKIKVADEDRDVQAGSIVYVAKNVEHRFHSIEEELKVFVRRPEPVEGFFAPAEYSSKS